MDNKNISIQNTHSLTAQDLKSADRINDQIKKTSIVEKTSRMHLLWAFLIPFGIMLGIYAALGTYPFGTSSVLVLDLNGQYVYFFEALRDAVWGDGSLFYSFSRAMGGEFLGMYAYYLASPLSYIVALFPRHMILEALYLMLILKCGLSGLTFCYYVNENKITKNKAAQVMFSCMYALSAYGVVMQHNTMWFDNVILLPIVALGIEKLIKERKYKMFTLSLALCVLSNFYIGYMVCIFTFVYFFFYYFSRSKKEINPLGEKGHFIRSISRVGIFSAIAIAISACILLPALYSLTLGKNNFSDPSYVPTQKFDFLDLLSMMYPGSYDTVRPEGLPIIYCGLPALIFLPLFFLSKHIKRREKIASGIFALFFILCFNLSTVDMFWHGMQRPNWLNYRYSFMLCFFILLLGLKVFDRIKEINRNAVLGICGAAAVLLFILQKMEYDNIPDFACVWFSLIFLVIYAIGIPLTSRSKYKLTATMILCVFVCLELFISGLLNLVALDDDVVISSYTSYHGFIDKLRPIIEDVEESDDSFYRMEKNVHRKVNDPMALGLRGFSNSTSTLNEDTITFLNKMGLASQSHWSKYVGATPVFDSLFGVKYLIAENDDKTVSPMYELYLVDSSTSYVAYKNPNALPLAYGVNPAIKDIALIDPNDLLDDDDEPVDVPAGYVDEQSPFERYNAIITAMLGSEEKIEVFKPVPEKIYDEESKTYIQKISSSSSNVTSAPIAGHQKYATKDTTLSGSVTYTVILPHELDEDTEIFCYFPSEYPREVKLSLNYASIGTYFGNETHRIVSLGSFSPDIEDPGKEETPEIRLIMTLTKSDLYIKNAEKYFYYLDKEVYNEVMTKLATCGYQIESYTEDTFEGTITVTEDMSTVFTSIPYDEGWEVYVDGKEIEIFETLDALVAFDLTPGTHTLKLQYRSDAMKLGAPLSTIGILVFVLIVVFEKHLRKLYFIIMPADRTPAADISIKEPSTNNVTDTFVIDDSEITTEDHSQTLPSNLPAVDLSDVNDSNNTNENQ